MRNGHYVAYVRIRNGSAHQWWRIDGQKVARAREEEAFAHPYIAFYGVDNYPAAPHHAKRPAPDPRNPESKIRRSDSRRRRNVDDADAGKAVRKTLSFRRNQCARDEYVPVPKFHTPNPIHKEITKLAGRDAKPVRDKTRKSAK